MSEEALFVSARLTQASIVKFCSRRLAGLPKDTPSFAPSKLNAWPTNPDPNVTLPANVPGLLPATSVAVPSPFHQLTKPELTGTQSGTTAGKHFPAEPAL